MCSPVDEQGLKYFPRFHRHCSRHQRTIIYNLGTEYNQAQYIYNFCSRHRVLSTTKHNVYTISALGTKYSHIQSLHQVQPSTIPIRYLLSARSAAAIALIQPFTATTVYSDLPAQFHALATTSGTRCVIKYFSGADIPHARPNCCVVILLLSGPSRDTVVALEGWN